LHQSVSAARERDTVRDSGDTGVGAGGAGGGVSGSVDSSIAMGEPPTFRASEVSKAVWSVEQANTTQQQQQETSGGGAGVGMGGGVGGAPSHPYLSMRSLMVGDGEHPPDVDIQRYALQLEGFLTEFKQQALEGFINAKKNAEDSLRYTLDSERHRFNSTLHTKENEICAMRQVQSTVQQMNDVLHHRLKGVVNLSPKVRDDEHMRALRSRCWAAWRAYVQMSKDTHLKTSLASALYHKRLCMSVFSSWRGRASRSAMEKKLAATKASSDIERNRLCALVNLERDRLQEELKHTQAQLKREVDTRALLQDNLKRVFMRGVCALNFEAMNILSNPTAAAQPSQQQQQQPTSPFAAFNMVPSAAAAGGVGVSGAQSAREYRGWGGGDNPTNSNERAPSFQGDDMTTSHQTMNMPADDGNVTEGGHESLDIPNEPPQPYKSDEHGAALVPKSATTGGWRSVDQLQHHQQQQPQYHHPHHQQHHAGMPPVVRVQSSRVTSAAVVGPAVSSVCQSNSSQTTIQPNADVGGPQQRTQTQTQHGRSIRN